MKTPETKRGIQYVPPKTFLNLFIHTNIVCASQNLENFGDVEELGSDIWNTDF